ncbi:hypothetical protein AB0I77_27655 [Streptomyces sp. NPDC050619]|uniref:hypothetical protein n=1 Tax=Streptomyces sp. NPDC050619 TaxID=3157214 RepID=UPI00341268DB
MTPPTAVDLTAEGELRGPRTGAMVPTANVRGFLARHLHVPESATDIVVFVHGWRNTPAAGSGTRRARTPVL